MAVDFALRETLFCGQCFRWEETSPGVFTGVAFGERCTVREGEEAALSENPLWKSYFDLGTDYGALRDALCQKSGVLRSAAAYAPGIRILRQEPFEALCTFIISQNNHIPRIRGIVEQLCEAFGEDRGGYHAFPAPEALCKLQTADLATLRCGYRDRYLLDAARKVAGGALDLEALRTLPLDEARARLMTVCGVGVKVADCVLLYGLHRMDAFPMDVWMKRAMARLFPGEEPSFFGEAAGLAQQYLFHYSRMHPEEFR